MNDLPILQNNTTQNYRLENSSLEAEKKDIEGSSGDPIFFKY
ncbi:unnamed protein product [marine sediment metagenome]|uniref:Uncharacterized protein n=1 Tax=marine sediment metagenome TaxID=412755 RepID=X1TWI7_9ZZZZ